MGEVGSTKDHWTTGVLPSMSLISMETGPAPQPLAAGDVNQQVPPQVAQDYSRQGLGPDLYVLLELGLAYEKVCDPSLASQRQSIIFGVFSCPL